MATRLAFAAAHRVRTPVLRSASSHVPTLSLGPRAVSCRRAALLTARSSTTSTATVGERAAASSSQHPPPATASPPQQATPQHHPSASAPAASGTSSAKGSTTKQPPSAETSSSSDGINISSSSSSRSSGSSGGVSSSSSSSSSRSTADPTATTTTTAAAGKGTHSDARDKGSSSSSGGDTTNNGGGGGNGGGQGGHRGPLTWGAVGLLGIVGALAMGYYRMKWDEKQKRVASEVTSTGKPALGGPFTLVDMHGRPVTDKDFHGKFVLLYFGFCHCPDICPSELVKVGAIAKKLEGKLGAGVVKPVFVSVDPDRDSLAQLRHYAQDFHPSIDYLTGTKDQVAKAAKAYRVYFSKTEEHDEDEDYMLDHSIVIYLLAPNGEFLDFFTQRATITDCVERAVKQVKEFKAQEA